MWGVSCRDVQRALAGLSVSGLLARARRRGTFVKGATERAIIGLLFGPPLTDEVTYFYRALLRAFRMDTRQRQWVGRPYDGLNLANDPDQPHYERADDNLKRDIRNYGFKGLIQIGVEPELSKPLEKEFHLPFARWSPAVGETDVEYDAHRFARESVAYLVAKGRTKLAYLRTPARKSKRSPDLDGFWDEIRARNLPKPDIVQVVRTAVGARQEAEIQKGMARAIRDWQSRASGLPDGLVVDDDVSMRGVACALLAAGVKAPDELMVVTLANEGVNLHYGVPVVRYEFSTTEVVRQLLEIMWKRMRGDVVQGLPVRIAGQIKEGQP
jgi:DNA-binding LacI/PurR family transcriptional regulator